MNPFKLRFLRRGTPTPTPTPTPSVAATYDTSIGNGVGSDGFASLPLHSGAKYIYLNSSIGSDSNSGLTNALPVATTSKATTLVTAGAGDQILVAQGTTYSASITEFTGHSGLSAAYPTVMQSYDSADPTNTAKYGRATGSNRPVFTNSFHSPVFAHGAINFIAFRGLDFNPGNVEGAVIDLLSGAFNVSYILWENCRFQYIMANIQGQAATPSLKYIFRLCSGHGQWHSSGDEQWIFSDYLDGLTVEDCVSYHSGWKEGASRSDTAANGGATIFSHPIYAQDTSPNSTVRRCVFIEGAADGGRIKAGGLYQNNLVLNCPISVSNGGGNSYSVAAPLGVYNDIAGCAGFGMSDIAGGGNGWGWEIDGNCVPGSAIRNSVLARSASGTANAYVIQSQPDINFGVYSYPTTIDVTNSVSYLVSVSGGSKQIVNNGATTTANFSNMVWDDPTSGSNTNVGSVTLPNAYTVSSLLTAINATYTSLTTAQTDWINNPDQRGWATGPALALVGYGVPAAALVDLKTTLSLTIGIASSGLLVGTLDGSTLTPSGLPTGVTLNSDTRVWRYDGSGTAGSGSYTITETNGASNHTTTLSYAVYARPVLSSMSVTPGTTTASASVSTNVGSGKLFWVVSTSATVPDWTSLRNGFDATGTANVKAHGTVSISATGSQSITGITGLTTATAYHLYGAQLDANNNPSLTSSFSFTTS